MFPLGTAYLPGDHVALNVFEPRYLEMVEDLMSTDRVFASVLIERGSEIGGDDLRHRHGVLITVDSVIRHEQFLLVTATATTECSVTRWLPDDPYPRAEVSTQDRGELREQQRFEIASSLTLLAQAIRIIHQTIAGGDDDVLLVDKMDNAVKIMAGGRWWDQRIEDHELWRAFWLLARNIPCGPFDRYSFLTPGDLLERVKRLKQTVEHVGEVAAFRFGQ